MPTSDRWVNIRCCSCLCDDGSTRKVLAALRTRLSKPKHPRDRGTVLGMERPQTQLRARPPSRSPRRPHGGGGSGHQGPPEDGARTGGPGVGSAESGHRSSSGADGNAYRSDIVPLGAGGSGGGGGGGGGGAAATNSKTTSVDVEGCAGESSERKGKVSSSSSSPVSPMRDTAPPAEMDKGGAQGGEASTREQYRNHVHAHSNEAPPPAEAPAPRTSAGKEPPPTESAASTAAAEATIPPRRADPLPLLPAGVGNLSLGQHRRRVGVQRRAPSSSSLKAVRTSPWGSSDPTQGRLRSADARHDCCGEGESDWARRDGEEAAEVGRLGRFVFWFFITGAVGSVPACVRGCVYAVLLWVRASCLRPLFGAFVVLCGTFLFCCCAKSAGGGGGGAAGAAAAAAVL